MKKIDKNVIPAHVPTVLDSDPYFPYYKSENVFDEQGRKTINYFNHTGEEEFFPFPIPMHSHEFYEINIVISGKGVHYINGGRVMAKLGDVFIINPNSEHGYYNLSDLKIFNILIEKTFFEKYNQDLISMDGYLSLFKIEPKLRGTNISNAFLSLDDKQFETILNDIALLEQYDGLNSYAHNIQCSIVFMMICKFCKFYHEKNIGKKVEKNNQVHTPIVIFAIEFMRSNLDQNLTIDIIAKKVFLSRSTFIRYFSDVTGTSPLVYLTRLRIEKAKNMLGNSDKTITYIANDCGFFDSSHFEKIFTKHEGISPSSFRKQSKSQIKNIEN